jgi:hypothetical protein
MREFKIANNRWRKQTVIVSDSVITILKSPGGAVVKQIKIADLVDITFIPVIFRFGGRKLDSPQGLLRLATSWAEQRIGFFGEALDEKVLGVYFSEESQSEAAELERYLRELPQLTLPPSPYIAQVNFPTFSISLTKDELIVNHAPVYLRLRHLIGSGFQHTGGEGVVSIRDVTAINFQPANSDRNTGGVFDGVLAFETSTTKLTPGIRRGPFHIRFPKSMNTAIREFCEVFRSQQASAGELVSPRPSDSSNSVAAHPGFPQSSSDLATQLANLAQLRDSGVLSEEEFEKAKAKLLG